MKKKICSSCGKRVPYSEKCKCDDKRRKIKNQYQKNYYQKNKESLKLLTQKRWKDLRKVIINRDNGCCQRCLIKYGIIETSKLQVHHIKPRIDYPELMYEESNLITVCQTCNLQLGVSGKLDFEYKLLDETIKFNL